MYNILPEKRLKMMSPSHSRQRHSLIKGWNGPSSSASYLSAIEHISFALFPFLVLRIYTFPSFAENFHLFLFFCLGFACFPIFLQGICMDIYITLRANKIHDSHNIFIFIHVVILPDTETVMSSGPRVSSCWLLYMCALKTVPSTTM